MSNSRMASDFDRYSAHYDDYTADPIKTWIGGNSSQYYLQLKADELCQHLHRLGLEPRKLSALDVGCGTGLAAQMLQGKFSELHGVDSSQGMIQQARQRELPGVVFRINDSKRLPFDDNRFDLVYSMSLLHHVAPALRHEVITEMTRVLKPGGWMINFEHNALNPLTCWIVKRCPLDQGVTLLRGAEMARLYRMHKLREIHARFILFFPKQLALFRALEPRMHWLPLGGQFYGCGQKPR
jgi:Methylase involved in ubiquinone/menaquinone biosynthesis